MLAGLCSTSFCLALLIQSQVKSNIGHSEPSAGISGLMKAILSIENGYIPGNPTFISPHPERMIPSIFGLFLFDLTWRQLISKSLR